MKAEKKVSPEEKEFEEEHGKIEYPRKDIIVIGITGPIGSGKSSVGDYICNEYSFKRVRIGDLVREEVLEAGIPITRESLGAYSKSKVEEDKDYWINLTLKKIEEVSKPWKSPFGGWSRRDKIIIDGIRFPWELTKWKRFFPRFKLILITSPEKLRFERVLERGDPRDPSNFEEFKEQERWEEKTFNWDNTFRRADFKVQNIDLPKTKEKVDKIIQKIQKERFGAIYFNRFITSSFNFRNIKINKILKEGVKDHFIFFYPENSSDVLSFINNLPNSQRLYLKNIKTGSALEIESHKFPIIKSFLKKEELEFEKLPSETFWITPKGERIPLTIEHLYWLRTDEAREKIIESGISSEEYDELLRTHQTGTLTRRMFILGWIRAGIISGILYIEFDSTLSSVFDRIDKIIRDFSQVVRVVHLEDPIAKKDVMSNIMDILSKKSLAIWYGPPVESSLRDIRKRIKEKERKKDVREPLFKGILGIQDHYATHHHWDLRLELPTDWIDKKFYEEFQEKVRENIEKGSPERAGKKESKTLMLSFAIPKHRLPRKIGDKVMAALTLPHSREYITESPKFFVIPEDLFGAGEVYLKYKGDYNLWKYNPNFKIVFEIIDGPYKGVYALINAFKEAPGEEETKGKQWLLVRSHEESKFRE